MAPAGDQNDDGCADLLIGQSFSGYIEDAWQPRHMFLYYGGTSADAQYDCKFTKWEGGPVGNIGDVNDDGYDDFGVCFGAPPSFELHLGGPTLSDTADFTINGSWSYLRPAADFDADGELELALSQNINGGPVKIFDIGPHHRDTIPKLILPDTAVSFGRNLAVGDFNGDGHADLAVAACWNRDSSFVKFYWGGPNFDAKEDLTLWSPSDQFGTLLVPLGDFNGDGYEDLYIGGGDEVAPLRSGIYFGGPGIDKQVDIPIWLSAYFWDDTLHYESPTSADCAGDINSDGYRDLVVGQILGSTGRFCLFLGGPHGDSLVDVRISEYDMPCVGDNCVCGLAVFVNGIGDFTGDGIDDLAIYGPLCGYGRTNAVHIICGWGGVATDVKEEQHGTPEAVVLAQNFPNPFNPSTTISFELPKRTTATLTIFNLLGERVITLLDRDLPAGSHQVTWDGRDDSGRPVASGVYLYRLETAEAVQTKKMLLLK